MTRYQPVPQHGGRFRLIAFSVNALA